jgi:hypothetical protein
MRNMENQLIKVVSNSDPLSQSELVNVFGGISKSFAESECTCDCLVSNKNETKKEKLKSYR